MLKIEPRYIQAVSTATSAEDLFSLIDAAIRLEHSTVPPYLTAMLSLAPGTNREIWSIIQSVVVGEMLHMTLACNLMNALGGRPVIYDAEFIPHYPGPLPLGISHGLVVGLEPFSLDLVEKTFMEIEEPEKPIVFPHVFAAEAEFATIGLFYHALIERIRDLGDRIFTGDPARQVTTNDWFPRERLFPIINVASAVMALEIIVEEGEGTPDSPIADDGDFAHYYRFQEIYYLRRLVRDPASPKGFSFSGPVLPFDPAGVYPLTKNQKLADLDAESEGGRRARQFSFIYTKLLKALQRVFDGDPGLFDAAFGLMFELKLAGQILCTLPAIKNGRPTGLNAGPTFEWQPINL